MSPQGWEIADYLLSRDDSTFQFFGGSTFRIKLGNSSNELDDNALIQIADRLLDWFVASVKRRDAPPVLRKLCSTLAFICTLDREIDTQTIVRRVILSIVHGKAIGFAVHDLPDPDDAFASLTEAQLSALLWFLTALTEEISKENAVKDAR